MRTPGKKALRPSVALVAALAIALLAVAPSAAMAAKPEKIKAPSVTPTQPHVGTLLTADPGEWTGSPTFTYEWRRAGIKIASGSTYTPTAADIGAPFSVTVTATNADGKTSATAKQTDILDGRFQVCGKVTAGTGAFEDARCTKAGGSAGYAWNWLSGSLPVKYSTGVPYKIFWAGGGLENEVNCYSSSGSGSINSSNFWGPEFSAALSLGTCVVTKPAGQGCKVVGYMNVPLSNLTGTTVSYTASPKLEIKASVGTFGSLTYEGCMVSSMNRSYSLNGTLFGHVNSANQQLQIDHSSIVVLGQAGWIEGGSRIEGESGEGIRVEA